MLVGIKLVNSEQIETEAQIIVIGKVLNSAIELVIRWIILETKFDLRSYFYNNRFTFSFIQF